MKKRHIRILKMQKKLPIFITCSMLSIGMLASTSYVKGAGFFSIPSILEKEIQNVTQSFVRDITNTIISDINNSIYDTISYELSTALFQKNNTTIGFNDKNDSYNKLYTDLFHDSPNSKLYETNELIANHDIVDVESSLGGRTSNSNSTHIKHFFFSGSLSERIYIVKEDTTIPLKYKATINKGKLKFAIVDPNNKVTKTIPLNNITEKTVTIPLKKGRNCIKLVGKNCYASNLFFSFGTVNKNLLIAQYDSEEAEIGANLKKQIKNNKNFNVNTLIESLDYMDEDDIDDCFESLLRQNIKLTEKQILKLALYIDDDLLDNFLRKNLNTGTLTPNAIKYLVDYIDDEVILANYVTEQTKKSPKAGMKLLLNIAYYMDKEDVANCLEAVGNEGYKIPKEELKQLAPFIDFDSLTNLSSITSKDAIKEIVHFMDYDALDKWVEQKSKRINALSIEEVKQLAPFLDSKTLENYITNALKKSKKLSISDIKDIAIFLNSNTLETFATSCIKNKVKLSTADIKDLTLFCNSSTISKLIYYNIKQYKNVSIEDIIDLAPFMKSQTVGDSVLAIIRQGKKLTKTQFKLLYPFLLSDDLYTLYQLLL